MGRVLFTFRLILVTVTGLFMAFHTSIFISRIVPNLIFAWTAAFLIEAMLISLALMRTWTSRALLVPLFFISVMAASMSFITKNEGILENFLQARDAQAQTGQTVQMLKQDLAETQKQFDLGDRYTTKTLQRERAIKDQIAKLMLSVKGQTGKLTIFNSAVFFVLVLILQLVSVYTATTLKAGLSQGPVSPSQASETTAISRETVRQPCETRQNGNREFENLSIGGSPEIEKTGIDKLETSEFQISGERENHGQGISTTEGHDHGENGNGTTEKVLKLKGEGIRPDVIAQKTGLSRSTVYRILKKGEDG